MDVAVIGGDVRFACLAQMLRAEGLDARAVGLEGADVTGVVHASPEEIGRAKWLVLNSPLQMKFTKQKLTLPDVLQLAGTGKRLIFAGPQAAPALAEEIFTTYDLSADEDFLCENAYLTAEGAISAAMARSPDALKDLRCLVIGWGRIGRALTELLVGIGAETTVASRSERNRKMAQSRGAAAIDNSEIAEVIPETDVVFSTPPAMVLDEKLLARTAKGAMIIDLASPPYGVDLEAAQRLGRNAWREPGLPGRYCPRSAARVLAECVMGMMEREGGGRDG